MKKLLWIIGLASLAVLSIEIASLIPKEASGQTATESHVSLHIEGMRCASCVAAIRTALRRLDGVKDASVVLAEKRADVSYDPSRVTPGRMVEAVNDLGYHARVEGEGRPSSDRP